MRDEPVLRIEDHRTVGELEVDFPVAHEFVIEVFDDPSAGGSGIRFVDRGLETQIDFPWWSPIEQDLSTWTRAPMGTPRRPFHDADQSWQVLIWRAGDWVFVMQGNGENEFHTWLKVRTVRYLAEWDGVLIQLPHS
ncbi:hypothetical protein ACQPXB_07900 [Amycolatopsis sp. CA-161197]|uniref:hypothetical protein n=1 Tax=unclassified Amycolatopsis TaxID=2618356 RepID=UPI0034546B82